MHSSHASSDTATIAILRKMVLALLLLGVVGTGVELLLMDHVEDIWQLIPVILIGLILTLLIWFAIDQTRRRASLRIFQWMMILFIFSGFLGTFLHYRAKQEFKLEVEPGLSGFQLFWQAIRGSTPPALAPASMIQFGLLGLTWTWRHPALGTPVGDQTPTPKG